MVDSDRSVIEAAFSDTRRPLFDRGAATGRPSADDAADGAQDDPTDDPAQPVPPPARLDGRLAVVTGATGLLGGAMAAELAARGARVCLIGRDLDSLRDAVARLGPGALTAMLRCDLASADDIVDATDFVERIGSPVDLLVHAAGAFSPTTVSDSAVDELDEHYLLDVRGPYLLTQRLLPLLEQACGRVVFFSSPCDPHAGVAAARDAHRSISQAGRGALAAALRAEVAPTDIGVLTVYTDGAVDEHDPDDAVAGFLQRCASTVLDALAVDALDVTELHLRRVDRGTPAERR